MERTLTISPLQLAFKMLITSVLLAFFLIQDVHAQLDVKQKYNEILQMWYAPLTQERCQVIKEGFILIKNRNKISLKKAKKDKGDPEYFNRFEAHWEKTFSEFDTMCEKYVKEKETVRRFCGELGVIFMSSPC